MKITSTNRPAQQKLAVPKWEKGEPVQLPPPNAEPDKVLLQNPGRTVIGAALGSAGLGLALNAAGGGSWGLAGAALGALAGGFIGRNSEQLAYDGKFLARYVGARLQAKSRADRNDQGKGALKPLTQAAVKAYDSAFDIKRKFDGYDSSRNIVALYSEEGAPEHSYRFAVELAHLRPAAQNGELDTTLELKHGESALFLELLDDKTLKIGSEKLSQDKFRLEHSTRYNQVVLELDKSLLRETLGWSDGEPMEMAVSTFAEGEEAVVDQVRARTDGRAGEKLFRWEGKTIYQVMTDRFHNGDATNDFGIDPTHHERFHGGDWQGVIDKLDHIDSLGADCIWLSCPYKNDRKFRDSDGYHGYWPSNFQEAESNFGDKAKLKELVDKAHKRGMKVILDVVVNHTGYKSPMASDPQYKDWFHKHGGRNPISQWGLENGSLVELPDLAQENPEVSHFLIDAHKMWVEESGVDGYRVDAIRHVPRKFLQDFDSKMREGKDDFITIGEVFWNDPYYLAGYQNETQDSLFDFPLMQAIRDVFGGNPNLSLGDRWNQFQETKKHNIGQAFIDLTKQGGSSMTKLSRVLEHDHAYDNPRKLSTILDNHDTGRFLSHAGGDREKLKLAAAFLFACRGTPSVYYGTETAMEGQMGANRHDMEFDQAPEVKEHFESLIKVRNESEALTLGTQHELLVENEIYAFSRVRPGQEVVCCFNNGAEDRTVVIPLEDTQVPDEAHLKSLLDDRQFQVKDGSVEVEIPAGDFLYLDWKT